MDMHVLTGNGSSWEVVMHFAVPNTNNAVGVNHRTALVNSSLGGTTVLPDGDGLAGTITGPEKGAIEAGALVEHKAHYRIETGGTTVENLRSSLRQFFATTRAEVLAQLAVRLKYFGHTEAQE